MIARVCKIKNTNYYSILLPDGTIKKADKASLTYFLTSFKNIDIVDMFKFGTDGNWNTEYDLMENFDAYTYAYVSDEHNLIIKDFEPFHIVLQTGQTIDNYVTVKEYAKMHNRSVPQIKVMCQNNRIQGVTKIGDRVWAIPKDAPYPEDGRLTAGGKYIGINKKNEN